MRLNRMLLFFSILALVMMLLGQVDNYASRSFRELWNLGHLAAFFCITLLVLRTIPAIASFHWPWRSLICLVLALIVGVLIELLQVPLGREASLTDIGNDLLGALLGVVIHAGLSNTIGTTRLVIFLFIICLIISGYNRAALIAFYDDMMAWRQFPVLLDFSTPFEPTRVRGNADRQYVSDKNLSYLKLRLGTERYSGFSLKHIPRDWRDYYAVQLEFLNPESDVIDLTCRIHDVQHSDGHEEYSDRFNHSYQLGPGVNHVTIPLHQVASAPRTRKLDLSRVGALGCFTTGLQTPRVIHLHAIRLFP